jgi:D-alanyl-D-alanine carboxypeptidase
MTSCLVTVTVEPVDRAPIAPPPLKARVPSPKTAAVRSRCSVGRANSNGSRATQGSRNRHAFDRSHPGRAAYTRSPAAPEAKRFVAAQREAHVGWIVQIGAFDIERDAQRQLTTAHAKAGQVLNNADPYTEVVMKGDQTLYRARFAGF